MNHRVPDIHRPPLATAHGYVLNWYTGILFTIYTYTLFVCTTYEYITDTAIPSYYINNILPDFKPERISKVFNLKKQKYTKYFFNMPDIKCLI